MQQAPKRVRAWERAALQGGWFADMTNSSERNVPVTCLKMAGMSRSVQIPMAMTSQTTAIAGNRRIRRLCRPVRMEASACSRGREKKRQHVKTSERPKIEKLKGPDRDSVDVGGKKSAPTGNAVN